MANLSADQIIEMGKKRGIDMSKYEGRIRQKMASGMANVPDEVINFRGQPQRTQQPEMPMRQSRGIVPDLLDKINPSGALSTTVGRAAQGFMAGLGVSPADNMGDDYSKLYTQEAIKKQFEKPTLIAEMDSQGNVVGYERAPQGEIKFPPRPLVQFGDIGEMAEGINEGEAPENSLGILEEAGDGMTIEQLTAEKEQRLQDSSYDPKVVEEVYQEELAKLQGNVQPNIAGDVLSEFGDLNEDDRQYLIQQGFEPEQINHIFEKSKERKTLNASTTGR